MAYAVGVLASVRIQWGGCVLANIVCRYQRAARGRAVEGRGPMTPDQFRREYCGDFSDELLPCDRCRFSQMHGHYDRGFCHACKKKEWRQFRMWRAKGGT